METKKVGTSTPKTRLVVTRNHETLIIPVLVLGFGMVGLDKVGGSMIAVVITVMQIYVPEFLRKPTVTDVEKFYLHHEEKHRFSGMLGSLDCTDWEWFDCSYAFKAQYVRRDNGSNPFILLEVVASQDLWICHAFFGVAGSNNNFNVLYQSPLFNDLKTGRASEIPFVANGVTYPSEYYLVDGIYSELAPLVKTIPEPADDDHKRILYKRKQESARKDVERAFGVLKKKWAILANPTRALKKEWIINMMSAQAHQNLRASLVEHLSRNA
nr:hypothetical protein [Tanacetum cinerariifolium]